MLKVEYPCRENFSLYQNHTKPVITWVEAKKHLHDVRLRRQNELTKNINECYKLQNIHKQIFNRQFNSTPTDVSVDTKSIKTVSDDYSSQINKYSIPRIDYAHIIYRQAIPTFETEKPSKLENEIPVVKELTECLTQSPYPISKNTKIQNDQSIRKDHKRCSSVSTVSSNDKRTNRVYEKWPDYDHISEIVGYRIDPPISKQITSNTIPSRPSDTINTTQRKRNKSSGFSTTSKQIKNLVSLNSPTRRQSSKTKKSTKTDITPIIIDKPSVPKTPLNLPIKDTKPKLPNILCPSSVTYSNRIQTRQWLTKNHFSSNGIRTLPLL